MFTIIISLTLTLTLLITTPTLRLRGPFKCYVTQMGWRVSDFLEKKRYEGVMFNVISVTRGWVGGGVQFPEKIALRNT